MYKTVLHMHIPKDTRVISLLPPFSALLVITVQEQKCNAGNLTQIQQNKTGALMIVSSSNLFKSDICHCLLLSPLPYMR